jgi:hypothetical protein
MFPIVDIIHLVVECVRLRRVSHVALFDIYLIYRQEPFIGNSAHDFGEI